MSSLQEYEDLKLTKGHSEEIDSEKTKQDRNRCIHGHFNLHWTLQYY
jgi:hypothetical protein